MDVTVKTNEKVTIYMTKKRYKKAQEMVVESYGHTFPSEVFRCFGIDVEAIK